MRVFEICCLLMCFKSYATSSRNIEASAVIEDSVVLGEFIHIADGCFIKGHSKIGDHSIIGPKATIVDSAIGEFCVFEKDTNVWNSGIGAHVRLGEKTVAIDSPIGMGTIINPGNRLHSTRIGDSVLILGNNLIHSNVSIASKSIIGSSTEIGRDVIINENCRISDNTTVHENCFIGAGTIVSTNVVIGRNTFVGRSARIDERANIGDEAIIFDSVHIPSNKTIPNKSVVIPALSNLHFYTTESFEPFSIAPSDMLIARNAKHETSSPGLNTRLRELFNHEFDQIITGCQTGTRVPSTTLSLIETLCLTACYDNIGFPRKFQIFDESIHGKILEKDVFKMLIQLEAIERDARREIRADVHCLIALDIIHGVRVAIDDINI